MTNEDLCNGMRAASEDRRVLLRQILRADGRHGTLHGCGERRPSTEVSHKMT